MRRWTDEPHRSLRRLRRGEPLGSTDPAHVAALESAWIGDLAEEIWLPKAPFAALLDIATEDFDNLLYPFYETHCGQVIASAKETLTVDSANADVARRLGIEEGKPVVVIERLALGFDRKPLEWRRSHGAADTFRYQVDIC